MARPGGKGLQISEGDGDSARAVLCAKVGLADDGSGVQVALVPVGRRGGPVSVVLLGAALGLLLGGSVIAIPLMRPGEVEYESDLILGLLALGLAALIGFTSGTVASGFGYLVMIAFRRVHLPPAAGLLLGSAVTGELIASLLAFCLIGGVDPLGVIPVVPLLIGCALLTLLWTLIRRPSGTKPSREEVSDPAHHHD